MKYKAIKAHWPLIYLTGAYASSQRSLSIKILGSLSFILSGEVLKYILGNTRLENWDLG